MLLKKVAAQTIHHLPSALSSFTQDLGIFRNFSFTIEHIFSKMLFLIASLCLILPAVRASDSLTETTVGLWPDPNFLPCRDGYTPFEDEFTCIKVVENMSLTWDEANAYCDKDDYGPLVRIESEDFNNKILALLTKGKRYWIGVRAECDKFKYSDGDGLTDFQPWARRQPNNYCKYDVCVEMRANAKGEWLDRRCNRKRPFVCQGYMVIQKKK